MAASERGLGLDQVQDEAFGALFRRFAKWRLYAAPLIFLLLLLALMQDPSPWRRWLLGCALFSAVLRAIYEYRRLTRSPFDRTRIPAILFVATPILGAVLLATGGIDSPAWPMIVPLAIFLTLFGLRIHALALIGLFSVALWVMAWLAQTSAIPDLLPEIFGGGPRVQMSPALRYTRAAMLNFTLVWAAMIGVLMRGAFASMVERALKSRDEVLQMHQDSTATLTGMAGEIAHELKNPLASVKGLAALVDRALPEKEHERMTVLRREVDRMQEILESFLNFSRPLVPLDAAGVRLRELCEAVVALHEGQAAERTVTLTVTGTEIEIRADARKLKQVLINLVQNALDASPAREQVELRVSRTASGARIDVCDRGQGLDDATRERAFEPGVTTKAKGSGLGLTVSRAIARQHGGEVRLHRRDGGGTVAELALPEQPAPAAGAAA